MRSLNQVVCATLILHVGQNRAYAHVDAPPSDFSSGETISMEACAESYKCCFKSGIDAR